MKIFLIAVTVFMSAIFIFSPLKSQAYGSFGGVCDRTATGADNSTTCLVQGTGHGDPIAGANGLLVKISNIVSIVAGAIAVIVVILGAIRIITANGSQESVVSGRRMAMGALIGLAIILLARAMIYLVINKL